MIRYKVNAALLPLNWTPEPWQVVYFPNPSLMNSIWLGTVWNVMVLPTRLYYEFFRLLFSPLWFLAPATLCVVIGGFFKWIGMGFAGQLRGTKLPMEIRANAVFMLPNECVHAIHAGDDRAIIDTAAQ